MAEKAGRPKVLVRRHVLEIKEDTREWIEETISSFTEKRSYGRNSRVIGAGIAATGVYVMARLINQFGRDVAQAAVDVAQDIFLMGAAGPFISIFTSILGRIEEAKGVPTPGDIPGDVRTALAAAGGFDPFAFGAALTAGGMVLAGINPGEVLKGIGSIIDALIPL